MKPYRTSKLVEEVVDALRPKLSAERERYLLRQSLHALVRAAKSEQMSEIRRSVQKAAGRKTSSASRGLARRAIRNASTSAAAKQYEFKFD